jgi:hypothetical protein
MGDAAVEFWAGDKLLGRPRPAPDGKSFQLDLDQVGSLEGLSVRAGGKRIDQAPARTTARLAAPATNPARLRPTSSIPASKVPIGRSAASTS